MTLSIIVAIITSVISGIVAWKRSLAPLGIFIISVMVVYLVFFLGFYIDSYNNSLLREVCTSIIALFVYGYLANRTVYEAIYIGKDIFKYFIPIILFVSVNTACMYFFTGNFPIAIFSNVSSIAILTAMKKDIPSKLFFLILILATTQDVAMLPFVPLLLGGGFHELMRIGVAIVGGIILFTIIKFLYIYLRFGYAKMFFYVFAFLIAIILKQIGNLHYFSCLFFLVLGIESAFYTYVDNNIEISKEHTEHRIDKIFGFFLIINLFVGIRGAIGKESFASSITMSQLIEYGIKGFFGYSWGLCSSFIAFCIVLLRRRDGYFFSISILKESILCASAQNLCGPTAMTLIISFLGNTSPAVMIPILVMAFVRESFGGMITNFFLIIFKMKPVYNIIPQGSKEKIDLY